MNTTIDDLVTHLDPRNCGLTVQLSKTAADEINARHRERMAEREAQLAKITAERDEVQHTLNQERAWRQEAERRPQAELDHLRLEVAFLTGRLKERQMAALQRENRLLEQVRDLRKVAEEALSLLKDLSDCFESPGHRWVWQESGRRIRAHVDSWRMRLNAVPTQTGTTEGGTV